jgi:hypothetical protein
MAMTAQAGDATKQPINQLNEASDLIHWPEGFHRNKPMLLFTTRYSLMLQPK